MTIKYVCDNEKSLCHIIISDTGAGIPDEEIDYIFDPFFRSRKHRLKVAGSGLGLSIVRNIIENHGGTIHVESQLNKGSQFTVTLPFKEIKENTITAVRKRIIIIGGVTAGPKAAARLRRLDEDCEITIIEKNEYIAYARCALPLYINGRIGSPKELMSAEDNIIQDVNFFKTIKNISVLKKTEVLAIDRKKKQVKCINNITGDILYLQYDVLVLATGAEPFFPEIKGIHNKGIYTLHSIQDATAIKNELLNKDAKDVFIIGGGLIGVEVAESLMKAGGRITILEKNSYILSLFDEEMARKIEKLLNGKGIKVLTDINIEEIIKYKNSLIIVSKEKKFYADIIILCTGILPNVKLGIESGLETGEYGGIKVNEYLQTSDENIFAIGDCVESQHMLTKKHVYWPLGSVSLKMGRIVADNICGKKNKFSGSIGTVMFRIFNYQVGRTGLTEKNAIANGYETESIVVSGMDKAHYFEDSGYMVLKIIADRKTQKIIGAQGYGKGNVVKHIEILAYAISNSMTLLEIFKVDQGFFPAFNHPNDIIQTGCSVLKSKIENFYKTISKREFIEDKKSLTIIDVSAPTEYEARAIPGSINMPLEYLRIEDFPFDLDSEILLCSKTSARAYEAYRYLITKGFKNMYILEGGYILYSGDTV